MKSSLINSIPGPPNITPLLPGSVLILKPEHGGGRLTVLIGTSH